MGLIGRIDPVGRIGLIARSGRIVRRSAIPQTWIYPHKGNSRMSISASASENPILVGLTGASGVVYGVRCVEALARRGGRVDLIVSDGARRVMETEMGLRASRSADLAGFLNLSGEELSRVRVFPLRDIAALPASGTYRVRAVVIIPASMKTCAALAHGYADNLITRAGDVALKERTPLVVVPRETPFSIIHLENLLTLARAGAIVLPAMPGFYHNPGSVEQMIEFVVMKVFDVLGLEHDFPHRWKGRETPDE